MAGDWLKIRCGLLERPELFHAAERLGVSYEALFLALFNVARWFGRQGHYGKMRIEPSVIDMFAQIPGLSSEMTRLGWLRSHGGVLCLNWFCDVSTSRKSLGRKVRRQVLDGAVCAACQAGSPLVIDHIVPVIRGGSCEIENLQALCAPCNSRKGRKTMDEFMGARGE